MSAVRLLDRLTDRERAEIQARMGARLAEAMAGAVAGFLNYKLTKAAVAGICGRIGVELVRQARVDGWKGVAIGADGTKGRSHLELVPSQQHVWVLQWVKPVAPGQLAEGTLALFVESPDGILMTFRAAGAWLAGMRSVQGEGGQWHE